MAQSGRVKNRAPAITLSSASSRSPANRTESFRFRKTMTAINSENCFQLSFVFFTVPNFDYNVLFEVKIIFYSRS